MFGLTFQPRQKAVSALLVGSVFWGLFWWPLKSLSMFGIQGGIVQVYAFGLSVLLLLPFVWNNLEQLRGQIRLILLIAALGGWATAALVTSLAAGSVVRVMLLFYLAPVWTILAARIFLGEAFTRLRFIALGLALAGLAATLGGSEIFSTPLSAIDMLALSSGLAFAFNNVAIRVGHGLPDTVRAVAINAGCALISFGFMCLEAKPMQTLDVMQLGMLSALGLFWVLPGTLATFYGVARLDAGKAAILLLAELVVAVFSAVLIGGEQLSMQEITGGFLILTAAIIEARSEAAAHI
ncbi:EamA-like transporter family protein [mine drainage metagenome]|uniref:EamA-like transporter family protein n=1 Tax=mine drainage metagenome TaxID=410659 RepID=A0A1J5S8Y7_9ZZZZ